MTTLTQGTKYTDTQGTEQIAQYDPNTGAKLASGQSVGIQPITSDSLTPTTPFTVTQAKPSTEADGLTAYIGQTAVQNQDAFAQAEAEQTEIAKTSKDQSLSALIQQMQGPGETGLQNQALEETGANQSQKEVQSLNSQLLAEQHSLERQLQALEKNPQGLFGGGLEQEMQKIKGDSLARQADIAVVLNAKQGQYDIARQIADRAVAAKMEVQKNKLDALKLTYEDNKAFFSKAEQRQFETMQADRERGLAMQTYQEKARFDELIKQHDPLYQAQLKKAQNDANPAAPTSTTNYVPGQNPSVDAWAARIYNNQSKITDIPASDKGMRDAVTVALQALGNSLSGGPTVTELGVAAKDTAQDLLNKFDKGQGTSAVGKSGLLNSFGYGFIPGTARANFVTDFNTLKSQLSLDAVKYLKGQGQVSDAERALLASAVTKLNLAQSEGEFKTTLKGIIDTLNGEKTPANTAAIVTAPDGTQIQITD